MSTTFTSLAEVSPYLIWPGAVATPIWDKAEQIDVSRYDNTPYAKALHGVRERISKGSARTLSCWLIFRVSTGGSPALPSNWEFNSESPFPRVTELPRR